MKIVPFFLWIIFPQQNFEKKDLDKKKIKKIKKYLNTKFKIVYLYEEIEIELEITIDLKDFIWRFLFLKL